MLDSPKEYIGIISQLNNEIYDLQEKLGNEDTNADFLELEKQAHIDALKTEINNLKQSNESYQKEIEAMRSQMLSGFLHGQSGENSLQDRLSSESLNSKIKMLEEQLENANYEIIKQKEELKSNKEFYVKEINRISNENKTSLENIMQTNQEYGTSDGEYNKLLSDYKAMKNNNLEINSILQKEINERFNVSRKLNELQSKYEKNLMKIQNENAEYASVFFSLKSMFNTSDSSQIISKIHNLLVDNGQTCDIDNEIKTLRESLENEIEKNRKLNDILNDKNLQDIELENTKLKERIEILLIQNKESNKSSFDEIQNKFQQDNKQLQKTIKKLENLNNKMKGEIESLQQEKEESEKENTKIKQEKEELMKENAKIKQEKEDLIKDNNKLQFEIENMKNEKEKLVKETPNNSSSFIVSDNQIQETLFEISQYFANLEVQNSLTTAISVLLSSIGSGEEDYKEPLSNLENAAQNSNKIVLNLMIKTFDQISVFQTTLQYIQGQINMLADQLDSYQEKQELIANPKLNQPSKNTKPSTKHKSKSKIPLPDSKFDITKSFSPRQSPTTTFMPKAKNSFVFN